MLNYWNKLNSKIVILHIFYTYCTGNNFFYFSDKKSHKKTNPMAWEFTVWPHIGRQTEWNVSPAIIWKQIISRLMFMTFSLIFNSIITSWNTFLTWLDTLYMYKTSVHLHYLIEIYNIHTAWVVSLLYKL